MHRPSTEELTVETSHVKVSLVWRVMGWLLLIAVLAGWIYRLHHAGNALELGNHRRNVRILES